MKHLKSYNENFPSMSNEIQILEKYFKEKLKSFSDDFISIDYEDNKNGKLQFGVKFKWIYTNKGFEMDIKNLHEISTLGLKIKEELNLEKVTFEKHLNSFYYILLTKDLTVYKDIIESNKMGLLWYTLKHIIK